MRFSLTAILCFSGSLVSVILMPFGLAKALAHENVLVLHSYHAELSWTASLKAGIDQGFRNSEKEIQIFHEYLDAKRYPDSTYDQAFLNYLKGKYQNTAIDLIMVSDDPALNFLMNHPVAPLNPAPIVFLGINHVQPQLLETSGMTGVFEHHSVTETVQEALRQTGADTVIVINDSSDTGQANQARIEEIDQLADAPEVIVVTDVAVNPVAPAEIASHFADYSQNWPIIIVGQLRDRSADGALIPFEQGVGILRSHLTHPLYGSTAMFLGHGVIGGNVLNGEYHATQAVELAQRVLAGEPIDSIPPVLNADNQWIFDYRELKRFSIPVANLPPNSQLLYPDPSFYERYKMLVWLISVGFFITLLIIGLLIEVLRRRAIAVSILRENKQRYKDLAEVGADVFWEVDANLKLSHLSGKLPSHLSPSAHDLLGKSYKAFFMQLSAVDVNSIYFEYLVSARKPVQDLIFQLCENDSSVRIFKVNARPIFDKQQQFSGYRGILREITEEYNLAETLAYQATYDSLTGLINRNEFDTRLRAIIKRAQQHDIVSVLCYLDLDQFKIVNDTAGHLVGDQLLSEVARLLKQSIGSDACLGRLGGDEFGLIVENCSIEKGRQLCQTLIDKVLSYRFEWQGRQFNVGVSIGMVPISRSQVSASELLSRADLACYKAKDLGRGRSYVAGGDDLELDVHQAQMSRIANLSQALEENRFFLMQQPMKSLTNPNGSPHVEILLRLVNDQGEVILPGQFIPLAERYGMIALVDRWVVETVIRHYETLFPDKTTVVSINLSGASLSDDRFIEFIQSLIHQSSLNPDRLCFEITETATISHLEQVREFMAQLRVLGVKFALDDFGSGFSSFGYLRSLPVDLLKIDGSLVRHIANQPCDRAIVESINTVAHMRNIQTVAEFVEDVNILNQVKFIGVDYAQGYAIGKPTVLTHPTLRFESIVGRS